MTDRRLLGRHALVVGGAGGLGAASVAALIAEGCTVEATGISEAEIAPWRDSPAHAGVKWHVLDVADDGAVQALATATLKLDILVNCAGTMARAKEFEEDSFLRVIDINLAGTMRCCRAFLPQLKARPGVVINFASMMSQFGSGTAPAYAASKGGVAQLTKSLAIAWAPHGIRVLAIAPGWIETPMSAVLKRDAPEYYDRVARRTPMGRWGEPDHIGKVVPLLCDDAMAWVTGVILPVDGGYSAV